MRQHALRALVLAAAITAVSLPVLHVTTASACDVYTLNNCSTTTTGGTNYIDTVTSPLTFTVSTAAFSETALAGEVNYTIPGSLSIAVSDMRGNNSGFVVQLSANDATAPGSNVSIPASDFTVTSSVATNGFCGISTYGGGCETLSGVLPTGDLSSPETVGVACASPYEGYGVYTLDEGLLLSIPLSQQPLNEIFGTNPHEWAASFNVSVLQGPAAGNSCVD
jgi:hypothetical protein